MFGELVFGGASFSFWLFSGSFFSCSLVELVLHGVFSWLFSCQFFVVSSWVSFCDCLVSWSLVVFLFLFGCPPVRFGRLSRCTFLQFLLEVGLLVGFCGVVRELWRTACTATAWGSWESQLSGFRGEIQR